ncbi:MAG: YkgJ family cysteine cluster protein [Sporomusaceae bacterium]|nr:YkgJ family cysteine cluster protein [Sporomusaceae bacterium]
MEIYLTAAGEVACRPPAPEGTVAGLLAAMERFGRGAVDCTDCAHTCCAGLPVFADNVFVRSLCALARPAVGGQEGDELARRVLRLDPLSRRWLLRPDGAGRCRLLAADGRCLIYRVRPLVCRLHLCLPSEAGFARLKDDLYFAYRHALACELAGPDGFAPAAAANPLIGATDYDAVIGLVAAWARAARPDGPQGLSP